MVEIWLFFGLMGWIVLMGFRLLTEGKPKAIGLASYVRGFLFSLLMGPVCFVFLAHLISRWLSQ